MILVRGVASVTPIVGALSKAALVNKISSHL
jgi:hypothetical protein